MCGKVDQPGQSGAIGVSPHIVEIYASCNKLHKGLLFEQFGVVVWQTGVGRVLAVVTFG